MCCSPDSAALAAAAGPRLDRLRAACADAGMGAFFVRDTSNIAWLTAFDGVFDDEDAHALLVTPSDAVLHTDSRYSEAARAAAAREGAVAVDDARVTHAKFVAETFAARHADRPSVEAEAIALGIEDSMSLAGFRALEAAFAEVPERPKLRETSDFIVNLRAVKDVQEIARMKAAQAVTDAAFAHIVGYMRPGMTEREVQIELEDFMRRHGAEGLAFPSIVAAGANGASPHAIPGQTVLEAGQCVVLDFGARAHGYCSDMTRTVFLGQPSQKMRDAYAAIRSANEQVFCRQDGPQLGPRRGHRHPRAARAVAAQRAAPRAGQRGDGRAGHLPAGRIRHAPGRFRRDHARRLRGLHPINPRSGDPVAGSPPGRWISGRKTAPMTILRGKIGR